MTKSPHEKLESAIRDWIVVDNLSSPPCTAEMLKASDRHLFKAIREYADSTKENASYLCVHLSPKELIALGGLTSFHGVSNEAVIRQALRHYQLLVERLAAGETVSWSGDAARVAEFAGPLTLDQNDPIPLRDDTLKEPNMVVNAHISDLFFNTDVSSAQLRDDGDFAGYDRDKLEDEADNVLFSLAALGVSNLPTKAELVDDFLTRF